MSDQGKEEHKNRALGTMAKASVIVFIGAVIDRVLGYVTRIILARGLLPSEYGLYFLALSVLSLGITLATMGLTGAMTHYVAYFAGMGEKNKVVGAIKSAFRLSVPASLIVFAVIFALSDVISNVVFGNAELTPVMMGFSFIVLFAPTLRIALSVTVGMHTVKHDVMIRAVYRTVATMLFIVVAFLLGFGLMGAIFGYVFGTVTATALAVYFMRRKVSAVFGGWSGGTPMGRKMIGYSFPLMFAGFTWSLLSQVNTIILGILRDASDVAFYNIALSNAEIILIFIVTLTGLFIPTISSFLSKNMMHEIKGVYRTIFRWGFYLSFPFFLFVFVFPEEIIILLFGSNYGGGGMSGSVLRLLSVGFFIYSFARLSQSILGILERTNLVFLNAILALGLNVPLDVLLIPEYGIYGAGLATMLSFIFYCVLNFVESYKLLGMHPFDRNVIRSIVSGIASVVIVYYISITFLVPAGIFQLLLLFVILLVLYTILLLVFGGLQREDLAMLDIAEKRMGIRIKWLRKIVRLFSA